jgi:hypothetical protein
MGVAGPPGITLIYSQERKIPSQPTTTIGARDGRKMGPGLTGVLHPEVDGDLESQKA